MKGQRQVLLLAAVPGQWELPFYFEFISNAQDSSQRPVSVIFDFFPSVF